MARRACSLLLIVVLLAVAAGCGGDDGADGPPGDCTRMEGTEFTFVAKNLMWNTDCLVVPVGVEITFTVDNQDEGVQHDLRISGQGSSAQTELFTGPGVRTLTHTFENEGYHQFVCTIHATMEGDIYAEEPPA